MHYYIIKQKGKQKHEKRLALSLPFSFLSSPLCFSTIIILLSLPPFPSSLQLHQKYYYIHSVEVSFPRMNQSMEDDDDSSNKWPAWVRALLETSFFGQCKVHAASHKNECNMFCLDCVNQPFCSICLTLHKDHRPIQIRRSSYHDVIRVCEIQKYLDITGVQTYVINSAKIVFLSHRPQPRPSAKGLTNNCRVCHRTLLHNFNFCSLGCKIVGTSNNNLEKQHIGMEVGDSEWMNGTRHNKQQAIVRNKIQSFSPSTPPQTSMMISTKRRKGIPHRAPT